MLGSKLVEVVSQIGKSALYKSGGMSFPVEIEDVKIGYGKVYYLIKNQLGEVKWTSEDVIHFATSEKARTAFTLIKDIAKEFIMP